jgi:hypothetical protein
MTDGASHEFSMNELDLKEGEPHVLESHRVSCGCCAIFSAILRLWSELPPTHAYIQQIKKILMPEDNEDAILLQIADHPGLDEHNNIVISW